MPAGQPASGGAQANGARGCLRAPRAAQVLDLRDNGKRSGVDQIRLNQQIRHGSMDITKAIGDLVQTMSKEASKRKVRPSVAFPRLPAALLAHALLRIAAISLHCRAARELSFAAGPTMLAKPHASFSSRDRSPT